MRYKSREDQRREELARKMGSIGLEAHLRNLARTALTGNHDAIREFQQMSQYAPPAMKVRVTEFIEESSA